MKKFANSKMCIIFDLSKTKTTMTTLNLQSKKVTKGTAKEIAEFVYNNRNELSLELKLFYGDVNGLIELQLNKAAKSRMTMEEILERAYNIDKYVLSSGAASYDVEFVNI